MYKYAPRFLYLSHLVFLFYTCYVRYSFLFLLSDPIWERCDSYESALLRVRLERLLLNGKVWLEGGREI